MGILKKIRLWWKSTPTKDKILYAIGGVSVAASVASIAAYVHVKNNEIPPVEDNAPDQNAKKEEPPTWVVDPKAEKWEVWNPEWELLYKSENGYESTRLSDALGVLLNQDDGLLSPEAVEEAEARVEDLARQFAYLEGEEDKFRSRFPFLKNHTEDIYENVELKGE